MHGADVASLRNAEQRAKWPLARLLRVVESVARALAHAHSRGIAHRDVKPTNVLLGEFGELYLADWGLARLLDDDARTDDLVGTPGYIAPEVVGGEDGIDDARRSLRARRHPLRGAPRAARHHGRIDAVDRPSAQEAADEIETYLEGEQEAERRREEARTLCAKAEEPVARYGNLHRRRDALRAEARAKAREIQPWEPVEKKRAVWEIEDAVVAAERDAGQALAQALDLYTKALGHDPQCAAAHGGIADLYWTRARVAEAERNLEAQTYYEALAAEHDTERFATLLREQAWISIDAAPARAEVIAQRWIEQSRFLVLGKPVHLGETPVKAAQLEPGSWLVTLRASGFRDVRYPVLLGRGERHDARVQLYTDAEIGEAFVYVPAGPAIVGGDDHAPGALPRQIVTVFDFAIARFPVTFREYCAFLESLEATQESEALVLKRAPHDLRGSERLLVERERGRWQPQHGGAMVPLGVAQRESWLHPRHGERAPARQVVAAAHVTRKTCRLASAKQCSHQDCLRRRRPMNAPTMPASARNSPAPFTPVPETAQPFLLSEPLSGSAAAGSPASASPDDGECPLLLYPPLLYPPLLYPLPLLLLLLLPGFRPPELPELEPYPPELEPYPPELP